MNYYLKKDIAKLAGVNPRTVNRWIDEARQGRLDFELHEEGGKYFISKVPKNQRLIQKLALERRKYLNKQNLKVVSPKPDFYKVYSEDQVLEIFSHIDTDREIPLKFTYFNEGASSWDAYANQMFNDDTANSLTSTIKLLDLNMSYLDEVLSQYSEVNIIDVGVGNALPSRNLLTHLIEKGKLKRYVAIDISASMLEIAEKNIHDWFGEKINFEGYTYDISVEPFASITAEPPSGAINIVLLLGSTLGNFDSPSYALDVVRKSMRRNDLLLYSQKLDSPQTRDQFNVLIKKEGQLLPPQCEFVLELLGIDESLYTIEMGYDEVERARYMRIRLKYALTLEVEVFSETWRIDLNKADSIIVWKARHFSHFEVENLLYEAGFNPLQKSRTPDNDFMLIMTDMRKRTL